MKEFEEYKMQTLLVIVAGVLLISQGITAQSGYNYARPELSVGGTGNISPTGNAVGRPLVAAFPAGATATAAAAQFPSSVGAYGVTGAGGSVNPSSGFAAFNAAPQTVGGGGSTAAIYNPSGGGVAVPATAYSGGAASSAGPKRQQRPAAGIFGNIALGGNQSPPQQFSSRAIASGPPGLSNDYADGDYSAIPGVPAVDYPVYAEVPPTNFDCAQQPLPGYYSDVEAQCQAFHICALNRTYSFLCPNGTIFSQATLVCVWWNQYDCVSAPSLYANNAFIYDYSNQGGPPGSGYQTPGTAGPRQASSLPSYPTVTNAGRPSGITPTASAASIYGSGNLRSSISALPTGPGSSAAVGRYTPSATVAAASFPTGPTAGAPATAFGATAIRGEGYPAAIQEAAYSGAQIGAKTSNREYLPPSRRP